MTRVRPNLKKADEESYSEAIRAALDERKDKMSSVMNQEQPTREATGGGGERDAAGKRTTTR